MAETVKLTEIANFVDMEPQYLKMAFSYFAPELMEPYKDWDLEDEGLNETIVFPDTKETWKLVAFTINNAYIEDMAEASDHALELIKILGVRQLEK
ncbi:MAG: hypothetical protein MJ181_11605 [Treponema sp.]|nr:hypothetical protein [Treponema sp.]